MPAPTANNAAAHRATDHAAAVQRCAGNDAAAQGRADSMPVVPSDPHALAQAVAEGMYAKDSATQALGMRIVDVGPGYAKLTMTVRADMLNGHQTCHGGFIFALSDSAFAFACNSRNVATVASGCSIDYLAPGYEGDVLTAEARECSLAGRTGLYDITVTNQAGRVMAVFRGRSYRIKGLVIGAPPEG